MKLVAELTVAFMIVTCAVLAIDGVFGVRHEERVFHADLVLDSSRMELRAGSRGSRRLLR